MINQII